MNLKAVSVMKKILLLAIAAVALIGGASLYRFLNEPDAPPNRKGAVQTAYRMQVEGLRFYGTNQGRRVVSIEADRFTLGKGKIGFFSTGLTRRATIENATSISTPCRRRHLPGTRRPQLDRPFTRNRDKPISNETGLTTSRFLPPAFREKVL
jgi:hypothetical protein